MTEFVTVREAATLLGVSDRTVRAAIKRGELRAYVPSGRRAPGRLGYRLRRADVLSWLAVRGNPPDSDRLDW